MLKIHQLPNHKPCSPNFQSNSDYSQIYQNMKNISLKQEQKITPKISLNDTFAKITQSAKNNMGNLKFNISNIKYIVQKLIAVGFGLFGAISLLGIIGLATGAFISIFAKATNELLDAINKDVQIVKQNLINTKEADKVSLQIDSLNNLYKNKSITLDELVKGVNEIKKKNKQN